MRKPFFVLAIVVTAAVLLAACGSSSDGADSVDSAAGGARVEQPTTSAPVASNSTFNDADIAFVQGMIPHHSQAVDMANLALDLSSNPTILDLAGRIQGGQDPEIEQMRGWLASWGEDEMSSDMEGMDMSSDDGMMDTNDMTALSEATGSAFDALFVNMMIRHHEGAITSANTVLADGSAPDVRSLAEAIIAAQEGEIAEMQALDLG